MEILWWLAPSVVVTAVAMAWVAWLSREGRGQVDRDVAVRRLADALQKDTPVRYAAPTPVRDRSTGIAVRRSRTEGASQGAVTGDPPSRRVS